MATKNIIESLKSSLSKYDIFDTNRLVSRPDWGTINFEGARFDVERLFKMIGYLKVMPIEHLPDSVAQDTDSRLKSAYAVFERVDKFALAGSDPSQRSSQLVSEIHSQVEQITKCVAQWIPFLAYQNGDVTRNIESLSAAVKKAEQITEDARAGITNKCNEIAEITQKAREAAASAGVAVFTQDFAEEAKGQERVAIAWLVATCIFVVCAFVISARSYYIDYAGLSREVLLAKWVSKAFCLSILITATLWCGRMYKSARHLAIINKHRAHSLRTFQAFTAASNNVQTRDAVLMETTRAIFSRGATGLVAEQVSADSDANIIQIAGKAIESVSSAK